MLILVASVVAFFRALLFSLKDPKFRGLVLFLLILILSGMIFYNRVEGWSYFNALYFCIITLATVGYGDITPKTYAGKLFTMVFIVFGIGVFVAFVNALVMDLAKRQTEQGIGVFRVPRPDAGQGESQQPQQQRQQEPQPPQQQPQQQPQQPSSPERPKDS